MSENNENKEPLNKNNKVPKLRFKEFKDTSLKLTNLSKESIINPRNVVPNSFNYIDLESVKNNKIIKFELINKTNAPSRAQRVISKDDILFSCVRPYQHNNTILSISGIFVASTGFAQIKYTEPYFLLPYFSNSRFSRDVNIRSTGSNYPAINSYDLSKIKLYLPSTQEQEKIGMFFKTLNFKIQILNDKISILKKYKEGMVKVHSRTCIKKALRDILSEENLKTKVNNQYEILSSTANGLFSQKEYFNHQVASENNIGYKIIKRGQLLFSPQNLWLGNINLNKEFEVGIVSPSYKIYNIDNSVNSTWLISTLKSPKLLYTYKLVSEQGASVVRRNLDLNQFLNITIDVPSNNEQIGNAISNLESKIDMLTSQLKTLEKMKVNLLNSMFI